MTTDAPSYSYLSGEVSLFVRPEDRLTWGMWSEILVVLKSFVLQNDFRGTQFGLLSLSIGPVGYGELTHTSTEMSSKAAAA